MEVVSRHRFLSGFGNSLVILNPRRAGSKGHTLAFDSRYGAMAQCHDRPLPLPSGAIVKHRATCLEVVTVKSDRFFTESRRAREIQ